jgi:hypothetical protein
MYPLRSSFFLSAECNLPDAAWQGASDFKVGSKACHAAASFFFLINLHHDVLAQLNCIPQPHFRRQSYSYTAACSSWLSLPHRMPGPMLWWVVCFGICMGDSANLSYSLSNTVSLWPSSSNGRRPFADYSDITRSRSNFQDQQAPLHLKLPHPRALHFSRAG